MKLSLTAKTFFFSWLGDDAAFQYVIKPSRSFYPSGVAASGIPTGVQIVGRPYDDEMVFRIGLTLEESTK